MGIFSKIFKKNTVLPAADLSVLQCDIHSHFIPGIDDGAQTIEDSLELLRGMKSLGYRKIITTPHVMADTYRNTTEIILTGLEKVREAIKAEGLEIDIDAAAEYYLDSHFMDLISKKDLLTFGDNFVLFELPFISEPPMLNEAIFELQIAGYKPVIAHAERYSYWYSNYNKFQDLIDRDVVIQLNINSITGYYSPATKTIAEKLIKDELVGLLGSDCHRVDHLAVIQAARTHEHLHLLLQSGKLLNHTL